MAATVTTPTRPVELALDRAAGIELLGDVHGSGYRDGAALVRRADGQIVQLGPLQYRLLEAVDGQRTTEELAAALCQALGRACDEEHVLALAQKLAAQGLLAGHEHNAPPRRNPLLALRWKVLVTNPKITRLITAPFTLFFQPWIVAPVVLAFLGVAWFVLFDKGIASATSDALNSPGLLLLVLALGIASAGFHELGHASACQYGGATPGGMGMGIYMVWPAFYTDVTDSYRLPKRDRLRVDLGGIYFNAVISVATLGLWLAWRRDALLLLIGLQLLMMVKNLSPVIRSDGYHILADATGVPDLYAHIGPTLKRLIPGREKDPSALTGRARALVTIWVLVIVPVLLSLMIGAVLLLPRLVTTAWDSGRTTVEAMGHESTTSVLAGVVRLFALVLPVVGSTLVAQKLLRLVVRKARAWSAGRPLRRALVVAAGALVACGAAYAWWPSGQYQPIHPTDRGTLLSFGHVVASPASQIRPKPRPVGISLARGTHLAVAMVPRGGATKTHPAVYFIPAKDGDPPVAIIDDGTGETTSTTTGTTTGQPAPGATSPTVAATAFPFKLPAKPKPGDSQALATGTQAGGVKYDVVYSLVTVKDGAPVTNENSAYALASCKACTTVAVSFQVVLVVGTSKLIAPVNVAEALNDNCPACLTTAIADQIVVTLKSQPTDELIAKIQAALKKLDAIKSLGTSATPAAIAATVTQVQQEIDDALQSSGQVTNTSPSGTATTPTPTTTTTPTASEPATTTAQTTPSAPATTTTPTTTTSTTTTTTTTPTTTESTTTTPSTATTETTTTSG